MIFILKYIPIEVITTRTTAVNIPNSLEIIENTGASPLPSNNTPKREAMEMKRRIFFVLLASFRSAILLAFVRIYPLFP
ncbi:MAG: hypothetical protein ACLU4N_06265 [Butyricimonas faecihominis]